MSSSTGNQPPQRVQSLNPAALVHILSGPSSPRPAVPGWEIGEALGEGGLGTVWKATRLSDGTTAALKVPRAEDIALIERLEAEADALRALDHPHIVRMLETGPLENGSLYLAMEYVDGAPLSHIIPSGGFPPARAYELFRQITAAVAHAHSRGILHRDLKPGNILIAADGTVRVADFGLAQSVAGRVLRLSLTYTGQVAGTAEYLPPEAYTTGYEPGLSTDLYALGVILYELLTGHPPRGAWPPVSTLKAGVDIRVDDLLRRALDPDPARRFPSVSALMAEFDRILGSLPRFSGTPRVTPAVRFLDFLWTFLGGFILLGALGLAIRVERYGFRLPVDLIGTETMRIGTWQACFVLAAAAVPLGLWQLIRLWRFRRVPLREALPSPFGLRLGSTRAAAVAVALAQLLFYPLSALAALHAWRTQCTHWLTETDSPWMEGLVVTEGYRGTVAHDPWAWPEEGKEYNLRERSGWINDPLSTQYDHTNFIPGLMPRLLLGMALFSAAVAALTLLSGAARWWRFRKWQQPLLTLLLLGYSAETLHAALSSLRASERLATESWQVNEWTHDKHAARAHEVLDLFHTHLPHAAPDFLPLLQHFAPGARLGDGPGLDHTQLPAALAAYAASVHSPHRRMGRIFHITRPWPGLEHFAAPAFCEDYTDPPGGPSTGALTLFLATGTIVPRQGVAIDRLQHHTLPLWTCDPRPLSSGEAETWVRTLLAALNSPPPAQAPGAPASLESCFYPHMLGPPAFEWDPPKALAINTAATAAAALRTATARGARPQLSAPPSPAQSRPGGIQRITLPLTDRGQPATWVADLIHTGGRWQCVRLLYSDRPGR